MVLIDKDTLVKELKRKRDKYINLFLSDEVQVLNEVLDYIGTLEVKEVDLEKYSRHYLLNEHKSPLTIDAFIKKAKKWFNRKNGIVITDTKAFFEEFIDYMGIE